MNKGAVIHVNRDGRVIANFVVTESISGGGKSQAVKARSNDDRDVFMKRFLSPIYPREAPVDDRKFEKRLEGCQRFEDRHREIMDRLSKPIVYGGNLVKPLHFFREKFNYYKVYPFVDSESSHAMVRRNHRPRSCSPRPSWPACASCTPATSCTATSSPTTSWCNGWVPALSPS